MKPGNGFISIIYFLYKGTFQRIEKTYKPQPLWDYPGTRSPSCTTPRQLIIYFDFKALEVFGWSGLAVQVRLMVHKKSRQTVGKKSSKNEEVLH